MKCEVICIVIVVGTAFGVVERRAAHHDQIVAVEEPVDILETVPLPLGMVQDDRPQFPRAKILRL